MLRLLKVGEYNSADARVSHAAVATAHNSQKDNVLIRMKAALNVKYGKERGLAYYEKYKTKNKERVKIHGRRSPWTKGLTAVEIKEQKRIRAGEVDKTEVDEMEDVEKDEGSHDNIEPAFLHYPSAGIAVLQYEPHHEIEFSAPVTGNEADDNQYQPLSPQTISPFPDRRDDPDGWIIDNIALRQGEYAFDWWRK